MEDVSLRIYPLLNLYFNFRLSDKMLAATPWIFEVF